jgi:resuscitation-promoting factor RpfB
MKFRRIVLLALVPLFLLAACRATTTPVTILADGRIIQFNSSQRLPAELLSEPGITLGVKDRLLYLGAMIQPDQPLPDAKAYTLTVRRAVQLTLVSPDGTRTLSSSAQTVGEALAEAGYSLYTSDRLDPPADTPLEEPLNITFQPARDLTITVDGSQVKVRSAAVKVGQALAEAGIPLVGLDYAVPSEDSPLPADGQVRVVRVVETIALSQKAIPYQTRTELSADLEIDQQAVLQSGEPGLAITSTRTRLEDGVPVGQQTETESIARPPQDRILGFGTKIVIRNAVVDGVTIEYWRALNVYTTFYTPCGFGTVKCLYYTSSRTLVRHGEVAMVYPWFLLFAHNQLYIPGYGPATVEDNNGAKTSAHWGTYWLDLGFSETDTKFWVNQYVTVYFLTPVPDNVADTYILP